MGTYAAPTSAPAGADVLQLDDVAYSPLGDQSIAVRVRGRWLARPAGRARNRRTTLVVEDRGRRHRFKEMPPRGRAIAHDPEAWSASFALPVWMADRIDGRMTLSVGDTELPVPPAIEGTQEAHSDEPAEAMSETASQTR